jgi:hypothetical protein
MQLLDVMMSSQILPVFIKAAVAMILAYNPVTLGCSGNLNLVP